MSASNKSECKMLMNHLKYEELMMPMYVAHTSHLRHRLLIACVFKIMQIRFNSIYGNYLMTCVRECQLLHKRRINHLVSVVVVAILLCKVRRQYLLTCKVSRYCLLSLHSSIHVQAGCNSSC